jgi:glycosyltransferase involved in cell wall biosynthesis
MPGIVIGIAFHSRAQPLVKAVVSAMAQAVAGHDVRVVVLDSSISGCARRLLRRLRFNQKVHVIRGSAKSAYAARNCLIRYSEGRWHDLIWHVRLDADDRFVAEGALANTLRAAKPRHRVVLAGNRQIGPDGALVGRNMPSGRILHRSYLLARLSRMAAGDFKAELPSCNLILRAGFGWRYPARRSAEDHWMVASILLTLRPEWVSVRRTELVNYALGGALTSANKKSAHYLLQRKALLEAAAGWSRDV